MNPKDNPQETLAALLPVLSSMPAAHQAIVLRIIADGPITGAEIGARLDQSGIWASTQMPAVRAALRHAARIDAMRGPGGGYVLRMLSAEERVEQNLKPEPAEVAPPQREVVPSAPAPRKPRARRLYRCPWPGGTFDLDETIAVNYEHGKVTIQMRHGSFQKGPTSHQAKAVAEDIEDVLASLEGNTVYSFEARQAALHEDQAAE